MLHVKSIHGYLEVINLYLRNSHTSKLYSSFSILYLKVDDRTPDRFLKGSKFSTICIYPLLVTNYIFFFLPKVTDQISHTLTHSLVYSTFIHYNSCLITLLDI